MPFPWLYGLFLPYKIIRCISTKTTTSDQSKRCRISIDPSTKPKTETQSLFQECLELWRRGLQWKQPVSHKLGGNSDQKRLQNEVYRRPSL